LRSGAKWTRYCVDDHQVHGHQGELRSRWQPDLQHVAP
jgi:hypothetical protein